MRRLAVLAALALALIQAPGVPAGAQTSLQWIIHGYVTDPAGNPRAGVEVRDGKDRWITQADGSFAFLEPGPGLYQITARPPEGMGGAGKTNLVLAHQPGLYRTDFVFGWDATLFAERFYDPASTASGPLTRPAWINAGADNPGQPGQAGRTCAWVTDSRTGEQTAATFTSISGSPPRSLWRWDLALPQGATEGTHTLRALVGDCVTRKSVTNTPDPVLYRVDNTAPDVAGPFPTGWTGPSPAIGFERANDPHFDIDGWYGCNHGIRLLLDGRWHSQHERCFGGYGSGRASDVVDNLAPGVHTAALYAVDRAGNRTPLHEFSFTVEVEPPAWSAWGPEGTTSDTTPKLTVTVVDHQAGVDPTSLDMTLSDARVSRRVTAAYDPATGRFEYQVPSSFTGPGLGQSPLADGRYEVRVSGKDRGANASSAAWAFEVRTLS